MVLNKSKLLKILALTLLLFPPVVLNSQSNSNGLTIIPAIISENLITGASKTYNFKLISDSNRTLNVELKSLTKDNQTGKPLFENELPEEVRSWFKLSSDLIKVKKGVNDYSLSINVPTTYVGNFNFSLVFTDSSSENPNAQDTSKTVANYQLLVPIVLNLKSKGTILVDSLFIQNILVNPTLTIDGDNNIKVSLKNNGQTFVIPRGVVTVEPIGIFKNIGKSQVSINTDKQILLRDGELHFDIPREYGSTAFGQMKATVYVVYGIENNVVTDEVVFWVIPSWVIMIGIVAILIAIFVIYKKFYKKKKHAKNK